MATLSPPDYRPLIGISSARFTHPDLGLQYHVAYRAIAIAVERAGGLPVVIPCELEINTLRALYERLGGILLPGGGDVDPAVYHAERHPSTYHIDTARDQTEITLARWSCEDRVPLFAICRGQQVVNVALGGTLLQDVGSMIQTNLEHHNTGNTPRDFLAHKVEIHANTHLARILGISKMGVNSIHHQAVDRLADSLIASANSPDGLIEAVELPGHPHFVGVQWHPEDLQAIPAMRKLFEGLVAATKQYALNHNIYPH